MWPTNADVLSASGNSGITITVESDRGSTTSLDSIVSKPSTKLSPELLKRLRTAAGRCLSYENLNGILFHVTHLKMKKLTTELPKKPVGQLSEVGRQVFLGSSSSLLPNKAKI